MDKADRSILEWREGIPLLMGESEDMTAAISLWLDELNRALDNCFHAKAVMTNLRVLSSSDDQFAQEICRHTHRCRADLINLAGGDAFSGLGGDIVILHFQSMDEYYRYVEVFYPEGEFGGSGGIQIRLGFPHIVIWGDGYQGIGVIAHELLHLAVMHRELPLWVEEGLAQMYESTKGSYTTLSSLHEEIDACRLYWQTNDVELLWQGDGFQGVEDTQKYSYMMAEMLVRNLAERFGKRSFLNRKKETAFLRFISTAHYEDGGEEAAKAELGIGLQDIAEEFINTPLR